MGCVFAKAAQRIQEHDCTASGYLAIKYIEYLEACIGSHEEITPNDIMICLDNVDNSDMSKAAKYKAYDALWSTYKEGGDKEW